MCSNEFVSLKLKQDRGVLKKIDNKKTVSWKIK